MKQFFRPVGTCLTTAVMTSTLLESYALALPETAPPPESLADTAAELSISPQDELTVGNGQLSIAPPEATPTAERSSDASSDTAVSPPPEPHPTPADTATSDSIPVPHEAIATPETVEAVRRVLDEKLAGLVARDKPLREAQLRDNLIASALQYAEQGTLDQARQTAQHPALPPDVQADLLAKIEAIAAQQPDSVAPAHPIAMQQPHAATVAALPGSPQRMLQNLRAIATSPLPCPTPAVATPVAVTAPSPPPAATAPPAAKANLAWAAKWSKIALTQPATPQTTPQAEVAKRPELPELPTTEPTVLDTVLVPAQLPLNGLQATPGVATLATPSQPALNPAIGSDGKSVESSALSAALTPKSVERSPKPTISQSSDPAEGIATVPITPALPPMLNALPLAWEMALGQLNWKALTLPVGDLTSAPLPKTPLPAPNPPGIASLTTPVVLQFVNPFINSLESQTPFALESGKQWQSVAKAPKAVAAEAPKPVSCGTLSPVVFNVGTQVQNLLAQQLSRLGAMFPLPIPAAITSAFGWRIHPISGTRRFHEGIDLGAPQGTPVLAATAGRVVAANSMGGYGLTVIVENDTTGHRNLYAHLSGIAVQPGSQVERGTVLGWVGSTGNSTGPHLHFEFQQRTATGWSAIDPIALANSVQRQ